MHAQFGIVLHSSGPLCFVGIFTDFSREFFVEGQDTAQQMKAKMKKDGLVLYLSCPLKPTMTIETTTTNFRYVKKEKEMQMKRNFSFHHEEKEGGGNLSSVVEAKKIRVFDIQLSTTEIF